MYIYTYVYIYIYQCCLGLCEWVYVQWGRAKGSYSSREQGISGMKPLIDWFTDGKRDRGGWRVTGGKRGRGGREISTKHQHMSPDCQQWRTYFFHRDSRTHTRKKKSCAQAWCTKIETATHCDTLQHTTAHRNTPQHTATQAHTRCTETQSLLVYGLAFLHLQHTATHCNTLQHTATPTHLPGFHHLISRGEEGGERRGIQDPD